MQVMGMCVMTEVIKLDVFLVLTLSWIFQFVVLDKYIKAYLLVKV